MNIFVAPRRLLSRPWKYKIILHQDQVRPHDWKQSAADPAHANRSCFRFQSQLLKLEEAGILVSQLKGKTRMFTWNPRYPYLKELQALLNRMIEFMPKAQRE
jgi:hypothetical protein